MKFDFNPRPPRRGRLDKDTVVNSILLISIHAPREGGDGVPDRRKQGANNFNPRPPRRGRPFPTRTNGVVCRFQSTPPAKGATMFSTGRAITFLISIHAPREGGDAGGNVFSTAHFYFNPRPPRRGRPSFEQSENAKSHFNPRPPRRGRPLCRHCQPSCSMLFQSTPPAKGATISAPLIFVISLFQSTPPAKGATDYPQQRQAAGDISIHAPREGGDISRDICSVS